MKPPKYVSETLNFSLLSPVYESAETHAYPLALFENDANNKLMLKTLEAIQEMANIGLNLLEHPIRVEGDYLMLFGVDILNTTNSMRPALINGVTGYETKIPLLKHPKCRGNLFAEISSSSTYVFLTAIQKRHSQEVALSSLPMDDIAHLLGISIIAHHGIEDFFALRKDKRNFILKALRYILFEEKDMEGEVMPEIYQIKQSIGRKNSVDRFYDNFIKQVYTHYDMMADTGITYPTLIESFEKAAIFSKYRAPHYAVFLELFKDQRILPAFIDASKAKPFQLQHLFFWLMKFQKKKIDNKDLDFCLQVLQNDYSIEEYLHVVDKHFSGGQLEGILDDMQCIQAMKEKGVSFLEVMLPAYLELIQHYRFSISPSQFLSKFILSDDYQHNEQSYQNLKELVSFTTWENFSKSLLSELSELESFFGSMNGFSSNAEKNKAKWKHLIKLLINSDNVIENWKFYLEHKGLMYQQCLSLDNKTYEEGLQDCDSFDEFRSLIESHNSIISAINTLSFTDFFETGEILASLKSDVIKPICTKAQYKALHRNPQFSDLLTLDMVIDSAHNRIIPVPFILDKPYLAIIVYTWYAGKTRHALLDIVTKGEISPTASCEGITMIKFLNKNAE